MNTLALLIKNQRYFFEKNKSLNDDKNTHLTANNFSVAEIIDLIIFSAVSDNKSRKTH